MVFLSRTMEQENTKSVIYAEKNHLLIQGYSKHNCEK